MSNQYQVARTNMLESFDCDIAIVGGGIAGLWLMNRLRQQGYSVILCEKNALGAGQTIRSQGILHGGTKYALTGALTSSALGVADMPAIWAACIKGIGEINLSAVKLLSDTHYLWTRGRYTAQIKNFISSKILKGESNVLSSMDYPELFQHKDFFGSVCAVKETVLDVPSLLKVLSEPFKEILLLVDEACEPILNRDKIESLHITSHGKKAYIKAKYYVFTAGEGNEFLLSHMINAPKMQRRPLQMTWLRFPGYFPEQNIFMHCIEGGSTPSITITTHQDQEKNTVWYLGGELSEAGIDYSSEEQIAYAKAELKRLFPWVNLSGTEWGTSKLNRAEIAQPGGKRPDSAYVTFFAKNALVAWPTKLVLAPLVAEKVSELINLAPSNITHQSFAWPRPEIANPLWWK